MSLLFHARQPIGAALTARLHDRPSAVHLLLV